MKRRELLASKKAPWNRHFLHPNCQTPVEFDTFRKREPVQRIATWLKMRLSSCAVPVRQSTSVPNASKNKAFTRYWALPGTVCATAAVPTLASAAYPVFATETARRSGPPLCARVDAMSEARQATICCDLSTSRSISRNEREPSSCRPCAKSATL